MAKFDEKGNLWIEVEVGCLPPNLLPLCGSFMEARDLGSGIATAVVAFNLTQYIRGAGTHVSVVRMWDLLEKVFNDPAQAEAYVAEQEEPGMYSVTKMQVE